MVQNTHASFKLTLVMILATVFIFGCSFGGNKSNPVVPGGDTTSQEVTGSEIREGSEGGNHILLGFNMIHIDATDPTDVQVEVVPVRSGELHLNILSLLEVGMCADCFSIVGITSPEPGVLDVDIEITHPLDDPTYTLFDVRGIMMFNGGHLFPASGLTMSDSSMGDGELLNAEGHTQLYNGSTLGQAGPLVTYYKGKFATPAVPNADLNGFLRHTTDDPGNTRNALYASDSVTRTYSLVMPSTTWVFGYAVDASWDLPTMPVTDPMTDFPDTANCIEPWKVAASSEPILDDGETELLIEVHDRQGTGSHADPVIECPELFDGQVTASLYGTGNGFALYNAIISNNKLADGGDYRCLISVEDNANSSSPDYIDLTGRGIYEVHVISTNGPGYLIWAKRAGGTDTDKGSGITTLSDGSTVVAGHFNGSATFGEGEANETVLVFAGSNDIFVARYNTDGTLAWAKRAGGTGSDICYGITTLSDDSTVVTGSFADSATFGEGEPNETILISDGYLDIFVARYSPDGNLAWAKRASGTFYEYGSGITTLSDDSTVVTGHFTDSVTFGEGETNETVLVSGGGTDVLVVRYNPDGTLAWAKRAGGTDTDTGYRITTLSDDSTVVTGYFKVSATFGEGEANETVLVSAGSNDIFVARYNPDGTLAWAKRAGGTEWDYGYGITTLSDDSTVVTGWLETSTNFGEGEANETVLVTAGLGDIFLARYNPDGYLVWAKQAGGTQYDKGSAITTLSDDSLVVTGYYMDLATFGEGEANETVLYSAANQDIFVARYNPDGTLAWAKQASGIYYNFGSAITTISDDSIVVTGWIEGSTTFGLGEPNETTLISEDNKDIFIAHYNP